MCVETQDQGQVDSADHQYSSICEQTSPYSLHRLFSHHASPGINIANPRDITLACTKVDTVSKAVLLNVSLAVSHSPTSYSLHHRVKRFLRYT